MSTQINDKLHTMDFDAIRLRIASPDVIRSWSSGEVLKPETINYRTQKPEKTGLFAEEIFGPTKDWECYCGKYKKVRYKGIICDKCGVEVTHSLVRRERMGHIELSAPVTHIWFFRSIPSKIGTILDLSVQAMEKVVYFANFIITDVDQDAKKETVQMLKDEFKSKKKQLTNEIKRNIAAAKEKGVDTKKVEDEGEEKMTALEEDFSIAERELKEIEVLHMLSENAFQELSYRYGHIFDAQIGADAIRYLLKRLDMTKTAAALDKEIETCTTAKRDKMIRRVKLLKSLIQNSIKPEWMILDVIPVIPPDLRPMVALDGGRFATSDLNDLYRRVINRNNRLKRLLDLKAPEVIVRNEKRMLQEAVDALIDNDARRGKTVTASTGQRRKLRSIADVLKGKQGRFRQNLLGKRVDYSGRSVIVVGPNMQMSECGLPKRMALELFKPFVMSKIIERGFAHNVRSASRYIDADHDEVWDILEEVIVDTRVLLNRAPTLHRLGIQAFTPRLIEGKAIRIHPMVCTAFNADFDGDQMAVHVPLTEQAKWEAENLMAAERNILKPSTGNPIATPKQDITLGCFYMTTMRPALEDVPKEKIKRFASERDARLAYKLRRIGLQEPIEVAFEDRSRFEKDAPARMVTTVGRIAFNDVLPKELPWYNEAVTGKTLSKIVRLALEKVSVESAAQTLDKMKTLGFKYVTKSGYSLGMDDFPHVPQKETILQDGDKRVQEVEDQYQDGLLTQNERYTKIIEIWTDVKDQVLKHNRDSLNNFGPVYAMIESGARGSWGQLGQVIGMKGLVSNPAGEIIELPVKGNFKEGFTVLEFFISSHGVRKGLTDTALRTANAGYLTRRLVDVAQDVVILEEDCGTPEGILVTREESERVMGEKISERIRGRFLVEDIVKPGGRKVLVKAGEMITEKQARELEDSAVEEVTVRSVLKCELPKGLCVKCYGVDLAKNRPVEKGTAVGIIAAQSIGEPGTQLTMRTFHTGGVAGVSDITQGLPRVEELFEVRNPKHKAHVSDVSGVVSIESAEGRVIESPTGRRIFEGRRGQKIVKVSYEGVNEETLKVLSKDDVKVEDGASVEKGQLLIERKDGEEVTATHPGTVRMAPRKMIVAYQGHHEKEFIIPLGLKLAVKDGDLVNSGDPLTEGYMDLKQLFELKDRAAVQTYILREIQEIYASQGQKLNDKHIEIIIRQLFSRVMVVDPGDTDLLPGETVEKAQLYYANTDLQKGQKPAEVEELLLGISRVALSTQSFLSSASFQETAKVLINAAVTGKIDYLEGLKENVIIGRKVPAGTGFAGSPIVIPEPEIVEPEELTDEEGEQEEVEVSGEESTTQEAPEEKKEEAPAK